MQEIGSVLVLVSLLTSSLVPATVSSQNTQERNKDEIIHLQARLSCDADRAFAMFTDNALLESWLAVKADVDPVAGGKYELYWRPEDPENDSTIGCRITGIDPPEFLSFEWKSPKQFKHFANSADPLTHVVVFFIPHESYTTVHVIHSGWRSSPEWDEARQWQEKAWTLVLKALEGMIHEPAPRTDPQAE